MESAFVGWNRHSRPRACGWREKRGGDQALGRSRGGFSTKIHLRADRFGKPVTWTLTPGQRHEATQAEALLTQGGVRRPSGQVRLRPARIAADKGSTGRRRRGVLKRRRIGAVLPRLTTEPRRGTKFDQAAYRERNQIERMIGRLKHHRAIATRYDKLASSYHAMLPIAVILLWV